MRGPILFVAALVTMSAAAFAADTPQPSASGEAAAPSGSNTTVPSNPPADVPNVVDEKASSVPETSPGEEIKGKPPIKEN